MDIREAKADVIRAGRELSESGLIARTWGNVSCRTDEEHFVITASGRNYLSLTEDEVIEVGIKDLSYEGDIKPSSEKKVHAAVYKIKEDVNFIVHTHQEYASAVSAMDIEAITADEKYDLLGGAVLCASYGLPGTDKLCKNSAAVVEASTGKAVIMKHHGALCFGRDRQEAFDAAHQLEKACREYLAEMDDIFAKEMTHSENGISEEEAFLEGERFNIDEGYLIQNTDDVVVDFSEEYMDLKPFLDDYAQMVGLRAPVVVDREERICKALKSSDVVIVNGNGALCRAGDFSDAQALSMLVRKNCMAYKAAASVGEARPMSRSDCFIMRQVYKNKYSKLAKKKD